jgi:hypothetical protein
MRGKSLSRPEPRQMSLRLLYDEEPQLSEAMERELLLALAAVLVDAARRGGLDEGGGHHGREDHR